MPLSFKKVKNGLLYSLIGLAAVGGLYGWTARNAYAGTFSLFPDQNSTGFSAGDVGVQNNIASEVICAWKDGVAVGDGLGRQYGSGTSITGIGEGWSITVPLVDGDYEVHGIAPASFVDCPTLFNTYTDSAFFSITGGGFTELSFKTRIISFTPAEGTTTPSGVPVDFSLHAYISSDDLGSFEGVKVTFHNIDQNVLFLSRFSPSDIYFFDRTQATTSGDFYFATSTILGDGNYRITVELQKTTIFGFINPFSGFLGTLDAQDHQFVVGTETFIGHISQQSNKELSQFFASSTATSSAALAGSCNPLGGFSIRDCMSFLLIPDAGALSDSLKTLKNGVLNRAPWGYITRIMSIMASTSTSTLPVISYTFQSDSPLSGKNITFDTNNYMTQAAALSNEMVSNTDHKTVWQIFATPVKLFIYLVLVLAMLRDVTGLPFVHHRK